MLVEEGAGVRVCRDPTKPYGMRQAAILFAVLFGIFVAICFGFGASRGSVVLLVVGACFLFGGLALVRLVLIDWELEVSADEVAFVRVSRRFLLRRKDRRAPRSDVAGYWRGDPFRSNTPVSVRGADGHNLHRFVGISTEVASPEEIDQVMARFGIPRVGEEHR